MAIRWARPATAVLRISICLLISACATAPPSTSTPGPPISPPVQSISSPDAAALLRDRVQAGVQTSTQLMTRLAAAAAGGDFASTSSAVDQLVAWASAERSWLTDTDGAGCPGPALDAYYSGLDDMTLAGLGLSILFIGDPASDVDQQEINRLTERLATGQMTINRAQALADAGSCEDVTPEPVPGSAVLDGPTFAAVAKELNGRYSAFLDTKPKADPVAHGEALLAIEQELLARASAWDQSIDGVAALVEAAGGISAILRGAVSTSSVDDAQSSLFVALLALEDQRAAADRIRSTLGLPAVTEDELF